MRSQYLNIILTLVLSTSLFSQGKFLNKGTNGLGISSGYGGGENVSNFGGNLGYSLNGMVDLGIALRKEVIDNRVLGDDLNSLSVSPSISFIQHYNQILMSVDLSYRHDYINSAGFDSLGIEASGDYYSAGSSVAKRISVGESFFIQPMINAQYIAGREKAYNPSPVNNQLSETEFHLSQSSIKNVPIYQEIPAGETRSNFVQKLIWGFGADFCFETPPNIILYLTPNIRFNDGDTFFGIQGGFVLQTSYSSVRAKQFIGRRDASVTSDQIEYLNIEGTLKKYSLVYQTEKTPMKVGDSFNIVRSAGQRKSRSEWIKIGVARVLKIQGFKVVLEVHLDDKSNKVTVDDKLEYRD